VGAYKRQAVRNISTVLAAAEPEDRLVISGAQIDRAIDSSVARALAR
jgi:hypothetical protein